MENEEKAIQKLDIFTLLEDFLRLAKRMWALGLVLVLVCGLGLTVVRHRSYRPIYEANASFTVRVANLLYASVSSYNEKTAQVMADTFPSLLTSNLLQKRVMEELGISGVPTMTISAAAQSSILTLTVRDPDPQRAYDVLNAVIKCYPEVAEFVVGSTVLILLDESGVPTDPIAAFDYKHYAFQGAFIGAVLWCGIVAFLIMIKNTVHNEEELRKVLNTPCLGQVPSVKLSKKMPYPLAHRWKNDTGFSESVRLLRLRVERALEEEGKKVLLVSSAVPGEGKTTVSVNLAAALAQKGRRVLLVDCDLRNPSVVKTLSTKNCPVGNEKSIVDYMGGKVTVVDMIQPTDQENLFVISGGPGKTADYTAMLSHERMARLIQAGRNLYDYVILDTPPCSLLTDAAEVAEYAEAGLIVIRQDYAARDQIVDGVQRLGDSKLPIIGCVLNNVHKSLSGGYGYAYGYRYGYGKKR